VSDEPGPDNKSHPARWSKEPETADEMLRSLVREVAALRKAILGEGQDSLVSSLRRLADRVDQLESRVNSIESRIVQVLGIAVVIGGVIAFFQADIRVAVGRLFGG